jgi:hypothetical protein
MSIRAHRIVEVRLAKFPSFRLWDNSKLMQFLEEKTDFLNSLNANGTGEAELPLEILKEAVKLSAALDIDDVTVKRLREDIGFAESNKKDYVIYECY